MTDLLGGGQNECGVPGHPSSPIILQGTTEGLKRGSRWSPEEGQYHINCLEILAASFAVKTFLKHKSDLSVLLLIDNTTAVAYLNHLGGTVSPKVTEITKDLWMWCLQRSITLRTQHLPGKENITADEESRVIRDKSDWMLNPSIFHRIQKNLGPVYLDLFASRLLPRFFSWRPDPLVMATDALLQDWSRMRAYANPPWILIGRVLAKIQASNPDLILLVAPIWPSQPWYPTLLGLLVDFPRLLPHQQDLYLCTEGMDLPEMLPCACGLSPPMVRDREAFKGGFQPPLKLGIMEDKESKSYNSLFQKWVGWCKEWDSDPISGPISKVVNFLAHLFELGYQYRSLNAYHSAISSTHDRVDGFSMGQHPTITHLLVEA